LILWLFLVPAPWSAAAGDSSAPAESSAITVPKSRLLAYLADNSTFTLSDARSAAEFAESHVAGALNIPFDADDDALSALPQDLDSPIVAYCGTGRRAGILQKRLTDAGYVDVQILQKDQLFWGDGLAVFNCAATSMAPATLNIEAPATSSAEEKP
jgi:rhodanese-related sulfurtransferase